MCVRLSNRARSTPATNVALLTFVRVRVFKDESRETEIDRFLLDLRCSNCQIF